MENLSYHSNQSARPLLSFCIDTKGNISINEDHQFRSSAINGHDDMLVITDLYPFILGDGYIDRREYQGGPLLFTGGNLR